jgi:hypothetical protein
LYALAIYLTKYISQARACGFGRRKKKLEVSQPIDRNKVLTARSNPFDEANTVTFVTSGVNHIRGWALKENQLKGHSWTGECR